MVPPYYLVITLHTNRSDAGPCVHSIPMQDFTLAKTAGRQYCEDLLRNTDWIYASYNVIKTGA